MDAVEYLKEYARNESKGGNSMIDLRNRTTKRQLESDLGRVMEFANEDTDLRKMCEYCDNWYGKEHDYNQCLDMPCFTFYRAYMFLNFSNTFPEP